MRLWVLGVWLVGSAQTAFAQETLPVNVDLPVDVEEEAAALATPPPAATTLSPLPAAAVPAPPPPFAPRTARPARSFVPTTNAPASSTTEYVDRTGTGRFGRVALELGAGIVGAASAGTVLGLAGAAIGQEAWAVTGTVGAVSGAIAGGSTAVFLAGRAQDGNGGYGWTMLGNGVGWLSVLGLAHAGVADDDAGLLIGLAVVLPIMGSVIGYEASSDASAREARARDEARTPLVAVLPQRDGAALAVTGTL